MPKIDNISLLYVNEKKWEMSLILLFPPKLAPNNSFFHETC